MAGLLDKYAGKKLERFEKPRGLLNIIAENPKEAAGLLADFTPVVGDVKSAYDGIQAAREGDMLGAGLGALGALPLVPNMAGMFIGKGAKTWDAVQASKAMEMEKAGADPRVIWKETGNWKGPDGQWRQEIPDNKASWLPTPEFLRRDGLTLQHQVMQHEPLFSAYDQLGDLVIKRGDMKGGSFAGVSIDGKLKPEYSDISLGTSAISNAGNGYRVNLDTAKSINIHELQHAVQETEGMARGGSSAFAFSDPQAFEIYDGIRKKIADPLSMQEYARQAWGSTSITQEIADDYKKYLKNAKKALTPEIDRAAQETAAKEYYRRLAGEAEARATQARMNMDAAQRREVFPEDSYDVPIDQLIIRGLLNP